MTDMIQFMTPVLSRPDTAQPPMTLWERLWHRCYREPIANDHVPTIKILNIIERVRGSEANLARFQMERSCGKR